MGKSINLTEMVYSETENREWILEGLLHTSTLNTVVANSGLGKSYFVLGAAFAVATGTEFLGYKAVKKRPVLYIDGEMGKSDIRERVISLGNAMDVEPDPDYLHFLTLEEFDNEMPNLADMNNWPMYNNEIRGKELIIIDNLDTCSSPVDKFDNEVTVWSRIRRWALAKRAEGYCILFVDHANKAGGQYGTSKKLNTMHTQISLKPVSFQVDTIAGNYFELHWEKGRLVPKKEQTPRFIEQFSNEVIEDTPRMWFESMPLKEFHIRTAHRFPTMKPERFAQMLGVSLEQAHYIKGEARKFGFNYQEVGHDQEQQQNSSNQGRDWSTDEIDLSGIDDLF